MSKTRLKCMSGEQRDLGASTHLLLQSLPPPLSIPSVPVDKLGPFRLQVGVDAAQGAAFVDGRLHMREAGKEAGEEGGREGSQSIAWQDQDRKAWTQTDGNATDILQQIQSKGLLRRTCCKDTRSSLRKSSPTPHAPPSPPALLSNLEVAHVKLLAQRVEIVRFRHGECCTMRG